MSQEANRNTTTRRAVLAGAPAAAVAMAGGTAVAAVTPDPIFAVIAEYKAASRAFSAACNDEEYDEDVTDEDVTEACHANWDAFDVVLETHHRCWRRRSARASGSARVRRRGLQLAWMDVQRRPQLPARHGREQLDAGDGGDAEGAAISERKPPSVKRGLSPRPWGMGHLQGEAADLERPHSVSPSLCGRMTGR
jgi:hypothetical protein